MQLAFCVVLMLPGLEDVWLGSVPTEATDINNGFVSWGTGKAIGAFWRNQCILKS